MATLGLRSAKRVYDIDGTYKPRQHGIEGIDKPWNHKSGRGINRQIVLDEAAMIAVRHSPVFPQSIIAQQCIMSRPPITNVLQPHQDDIMAPVPEGGISTLIPKRGEWAVRYDSQSDRHTSVPLGVARIHDTIVYTCGNGVPIDQPIIFVGIVTNAQDLMQDNDPSNPRDNVGACDIGGTVTGLNHGPEKISAGDFVYIGLPYMIDAVVVAGVAQKRIPGVCSAGTPKDKAMFGTYRMKWNNVSTAIASIKHFLEAAYDKLKTQELRTAFVNKANLENFLYIQHGIRKELPLYQYAILHVNQHHYLRSSMSSIDVASLPFDIVAKHLVKVAAGSERQTAIAALNECVSSMQVVDKKYRAENGKYQKTLGRMIPEGSGPGYPVGQMKAIDHADVKSDKDEAFINLHIYQELSRLKELAIDLMHNFMRQRLMGKALTNSEPGTQLDINLGYFAG